MSEERNNFTEDTKFAYRNIGYGLTSYEPGDDFSHFEEDGKAMMTGTFDRDGGLKWMNGHWTYSSGLGMVVSVVLWDDLTDAQKAEVTEQM